jgi:hypothetical protein
MPLPATPHPVDHDAVEEVAGLVASASPATVKDLRGLRAANPGRFWVSIGAHERLIAAGTLKIGESDVEWLKHGYLYESQSYALIGNVQVHPKAWSAFDRHAFVALLGGAAPQATNWLARCAALRGPLADGTLRKLVQAIPAGSTLGETWRWRRLAAARIFVDAALSTPALSEADLLAWAPVPVREDPDKYSEWMQFPERPEWSLGSAIIGHPNATPAVYTAVAKQALLDAGTWTALAATKAARQTPAVRDILRKVGGGLSFMTAYCTLDEEGEAFWQGLSRLLVSDRDDALNWVVGILEHPDCHGVPTLDPTVLQILLEHDHPDIRMATLKALSRRTADPIILGPSQATVPTALSPAPRR